MIDFSDLIAQYERRNLDTLHPPPIDLAATLDGLEFVRVRSIAAFWRTCPEGESPPSGSDLVLSASSYATWFALVLCGSAEGLGVHVALEAPGTISRLAESAYPGLIVDPKPNPNLGSSLRANFKYAGMLAGVPTLGRESADRRSPDRVSTVLSRVVRGMRGSTWSLAIRAHPYDAARTIEERRLVLDQLTAVASAARHNVQTTLQESRPRTDHVSRSVSEVLGGEMVDRTAEYLVELLENQLDRLDEAMAVGRWQVAVNYGASDPESARRLGGLLAGTLSGPDSRPERIRTRSSALGARTDESDFHTLLTSRELGVLTELPREEVPGYRVIDFVPFDVDIEPLAATRPRVRLGQVLRGGVPSGGIYEIALDDLAKHALVAGVTGSGKTTTIRAIMAAAARQGVPFLVIEPAKTEYRVLAGRYKDAGAAGLLPDLRIYTLGNDAAAPFRLNPFEFETDDDPTISLLAGHINLLKASFNAAFVLYAPMPYVLDVALHEVYEDKGWNLATGQNLRALPDWKRRDELPIFPTLAGLERKTGEVTRRLGYDSRIEQDVTAGLRARIGALRVGAKGLMLDLQRGNSIAELLGHPTVLEFEAIGNDDEKAFVMGLVLARLYEYRRLQSSGGKIRPGLRHVVVIEEAHRLLRKVSMDVDSESSNLRSQAVETFVNMMSEMRSYGQGLIVAEQIPSKLAPDAVKNANLKVMHRVVAEDDRLLLAGSTNMTDDQARQLATLLPGTAAVFAEGADHPYVVAVDNVLDGSSASSPSDHAVADLASNYVNLGRYLSVPDCARFGVPPARFGGPDPSLLQTALRFDSGPAADAGIWPRLILRTIYARTRLAAELTEFERLFSNQARVQLSGGQIRVALRLAVVIGASRAIQERAADHNWPYRSAVAMSEELTAGLLGEVREAGNVEATSHLDRFARSYEQQTETAHGPFPGCPSCPNSCRFRSEVRRSALPTSLIGLTRLADQDRPKLPEVLSVVKTISGVANEWLGVTGGAPAGLAYCIALSAGAASGCDNRGQAELARQLEPHLL